MTYTNNSKCQYIIIQVLSLRIWHLDMLCDGWRVTRDFANTSHERKFENAVARNESGFGQIETTDK